LAHGGKLVFLIHKIRYPHGQYLSELEWFQQKWRLGPINLYLDIYFKVIINTSLKYSVSSQTGSYKTVQNEVQNVFKKRAATYLNLHLHKPHSPKSDFIPVKN
jgi:hypothetical protein